MNHSRHFDPVKGSTGFDEAKKKENFLKSCAEIEAKVRKYGPWASIKRVAAFDVTTHKSCRSCGKVKEVTMFAIAKRHGERISRRSTCKECMRAKEAEARGL